MLMTPAFTWQCPPDRTPNPHAGPCGDAVPHPLPALPWKSPSSDNTHLQLSTEPVKSFHSAHFPPSSCGEHLFQLQLLLWLLKKPLSLCPNMATGPSTWRQVPESCSAMLSAVPDYAPCQKMVHIVNNRVEDTKSSLAWRTKFCARCTAVKELPSLRSS